MRSIPTKEENPDGLHERYIIAKVDGSPTDKNAEYFVLRLDKGGKDQKHMKACRRAIINYALDIDEHLPELSEDLVLKYGSIDDYNTWKALREIKNLSIKELRKLAKQNIID